MVGMQPASGSLLIASAMLVDPNFARCVLFILESNDEGSLGVILNQPSETPVGEVLAPWQDVVNPPGVFFRGGPVDLNAALALGSLLDEDEPPPGWRTLAGSLGMVDLDSSPDDFLGRLNGLRIYAGYAGWGAGQLDAEIAEGSWHVVPARHGDLFSASPTSCGARSCAASRHRCRCWPRCPRTPASTERAARAARSRVVSHLLVQRRRLGRLLTSPTPRGPPDADPRRAPPQRHDVRSRRRPADRVPRPLLDVEPARLALPGARPATGVRPRHPDRHVGPPRPRRLDPDPPPGSHHRACWPATWATWSTRWRPPARWSSPVTRSAA